jgi:hypothetical protein
MAGESITIEWVVSPHRMVLHGLFTPHSKCTCIRNPILVACPVGNHLAEARPAYEQVLSINPRLAEARQALTTLQ